MANKKSEIISNNNSVSLNRQEIISQNILTTKIL